MVDAFVVVLRYVVGSELARVGGACILRYMLGWPGVVDGSWRWRASLALINGA